MPLSDLRERDKSWQVWFSGCMIWIVIAATYIVVGASGYIMGHADGQDGQRFWLFRSRRRQDWVTSVDDGALVDILLQRWPVVTMNGPASHECMWTVQCDDANTGVTYRATTPREALDMAVTALKEEDES